MQTNLLQDLATYLIVGLIWGAIIEHIESKQKDRQPPKTMKARVVIILTWPITVFLMLLGMIRNLLTGK
jgi:hypothetical protein